MRPTPIDSELLAKFMAGEAGDTERAAVEQWVAASEANGRELQRMQRIWEWGAAGTDLPALDVDAAYERLSARIAQEEGGGRVIPIHRTWSWTTWVAAAAVITGLVFAIRWFLQPGTERYTAEAVHVTAVLADSSEVTLSPGSHLDVRLSNKRRVKLQGEAYFEVQRDETRPFTVESGEVLVTVLGTAFEVSAYDTADAVLVRVRSGRVRVEAGTDVVELTAGQHARFDKGRHFLERKAAPPAEAWGVRILHFEEAGLKEVVAQLERLYPVRITLANEALQRCKLTAEFDDETIEVILGVIAETFGLELQQNENGFLLDGNGC